MVPVAICVRVGVAGFRACRPCCVATISFGDLCWPAGHPASVRSVLSVPAARTVVRAAVRQVQQNRYHDQGDQGPEAVGTSQALNHRAVHYVGSTLGAWIAY